MRIVLKSVILVCLLGVFFTTSPVYPGESEPSGFRGISWGTDISSHAEKMSLAFTDKENGGIDYYVREGDQLKVGEASVTGIYYGFLGGKLCKVKIETRGSKNFSALKEEFIDKYGEGVRIRGSLCKEKYYWFGGEITSLLFEEDHCKIKGVLYMSSKEILAKQKKKRW